MAAMPLQLPGTSAAAESAHRAFLAALQHGASAREQFGGAVIPLVNVGAAWLLHGDHHHNDRHERRDKRGNNRNERWSHQDRVRRC